MFRNEAKVDTDNKLSTRLTMLAIEKNLTELFDQVDRHDREKGRLLVTWSLLQANIQDQQMTKIRLESLIAGPVYKHDAELKKKYTREYQKLYKENQASFQDSATQLMEEIQNLASYAKPDSIDKLCQSIDKLLKTLYNFFFAGAIIAEHRYIGDIPPKSELYFFSSPSPALAAKKHLEVLKSTIECPLTSP